LYKEFIEKKEGLKLYDILVAKDGATTGKTAIINKDFPFLKGENSLAIFSEHVFRMRLKEGVNPLYIHAFLNSELGQLQLETITSGGAQGGIGKGFVDEIFVPLINNDAQQKIAGLWVKNMTDAKKLRQKYEESVEQAKINVDLTIEKSPTIPDKELEKILEIEEIIE